MDISVFTDKTTTPNNNDLSLAIGSSYELWQEIRGFVFEKYPKAIEEWNFPGAKYGWSFRIKDKKRAIIYLLPRKGYFKAAFVFGNKAMEQIRSSNISTGIITELENARVYAEGRGIRIEVKDKLVMADVKTLIKIKMGA